jgi:hypothetical protein
MIRWRMQQFMVGRYGHDQLNQVLMIAALVCSVASMLSGWGILYTASWVLMGFGIFRMLSRNIYKRRSEAYAWLALKQRVQPRAFRFRQRLQDRRTHRRYRCPQCRQELRVPKGKGKISITCPKCKMQFIKKT